MDHPFENLGPERFQQMCQALLVKEFPGVSAFPVGQPDGGRDAIQHLMPRLANASEVRSVVFQVKFARAIPEDIDDWVMESAKGEVEKVKRLKARGAVAYHFISNVPGTAHLEVGSIDRVQRQLQELFDIPVVAWWRDDLNRRLDSSWDIKLRYPDTLNGQDFFRLLLESPAGARVAARMNAVNAFISDQYQEDEDVKFKQIELQNKLLDLFVDLPFKIEFRRPVGAFSVPPHANLSIITTPGSGGSRIISDDSGEHEPSGGTASLLLTDCNSDALDKIVVEGAPGQGKSTLVQYLCQVHRIRILNKSSDLGRLPKEHAIAPLFIPFKVDLRDLSEWLSGGHPFSAAPQTGQSGSDPRTLETFLAHLVTQRSGGIKFEVADLIEIVKTNPVLIALDGLDEVADIKRRAEVVSAVTKATNRLSENSQHLRVLVTSRPAAFANSPGFDSIIFPRLQLGSVKRVQINRYAEKWLNARGVLRSDRTEFEQILAEKLDLPHLRDLSKNPMQLAILLSLILTRGSALPDKRTTLYDYYVDLFFSRESSKNFVVRKYLDLLKDIHRFLAWKLHTAAEAGRAAASGRFTTAQLKDVLRQYLEIEGQSTVVIDEIFNVTVARVFMIVSRIEGTYEFEVQPLREYFAARYLNDTAPYSPPGKERPGTKPDRFDAVARNFYWLNVARFLCGCFNKGELFDLADRIGQLAAEGEIARTRHPVTLATMLLSDWVFSQVPRALEHVVSSLAERKNLFRVLPTEYWNPTGAIRIPNDSGGKELVEKARAWLLEEDLRSDLQNRLGAFISANVPHPENVEWWKGIKARTASNVHWLAIADALGILNWLDPEELRNLLGSEPQRPEIAMLWGTRCLDTAIQDEGGLRQVTDFFLSGTRWITGMLSETKLHLVPHIVTELPSIVGTGSPDMFDYIVQQYEERLQRDLESGQSNEINSLEKVFRDFSIKFVTRYRENPEVNDQLFWIPIIEEARKIFGHSPVIANAALRVVFMRGGRPGRPKRAELFDESVALVDRMRFAKFQSDDVEWWVGTSKVADTQYKKAVWLMSLFAFSSTAFWDLHQRRIGEVLDGWLAPEFDALAAFMTLGHGGPGLRSGGPSSAKAGAISSARLALLLASKNAERFGTHALLTHFLHSTNKSVPVLRLRQGEAFKAAVNGSLDWGQALQIIEEVYAAGEWFALDLVLLDFRAQKDSLPPAVVEQIFAKEHAYPADLVDLAIRLATNEVTKKVRPVGTTAIRENWFQ